VASKATNIHLADLRLILIATYLKKNTAKNPTSVNTP